MLALIKPQRTPESPAAMPAPEAARPRVPYVVLDHCRTASHTSTSLTCSAATFDHAPLIMGNK